MKLNISNKDSNNAASTNQHHSFTDNKEKKNSQLIQLWHQQATSVAQHHQTLKHNQPSDWQSDL